MIELIWQTKTVKLKDLKPLEKNPFGKLKPKNRERLEGKLKRLGVFQIPTVDTDMNLLSFNKRWHILIALGKAEQEIDIRFPSRELTEQERKEIILDDNIHEGEWIDEILRDEFADLVNFEEIGLDVDLEFEEPELEEIEAEYPIVAKFSESYNAIVIVVDNEIDYNFLKTTLNLDTEKCYKSSKVGETHVMSAQKFISEWNKLK